MELSRRQVLSIVPAAVLLARAVPASADPVADLGRLRANTVDVFAGTAESNARPEVAPKLAAIERTARARLADMDAAGDGELFANLPLGTNDANLNRAFQNLYEIALATRAPRSALFGDAAVRQRVLDGLVWLHTHHYGDQAAGYYGNWFNWEIGISTSATKALLLLDAPADLVSTYVASMDAYLRNGKDGDVDLDSRFHTGANLADITTNRILQGALLADEARVTKAVADQSTVFATVDPYHLQHGVTDGYYADGSFIQHHSVAYTGSYGRALLSRVVQAVKILDGTAYAGDAGLIDTVRGWVVNGFAPLIFEGWLMEVVKGRAVSRSTTGYGDVTSIVEAIVDLADYVADPVPLRAYVKFLRSAAIDPAAFVSPVSVRRYADVLASPVPAADLNPPSRSVAFNAMDRTVHRRPGYAFALARSSDRISKYEYMNGENLLPWFQGDGAYYLYLSGQDQSDSFGVDYYTTVSPYRLSGVTVLAEDRRTIPELYGRFWYENPAAGFTSSSEAQNKYVYFPRGTNEFSGGATLGPYGVAGMVTSDDVPYVDKRAGLLPDDFVAYPNVRVTKSWFLFDDEIVALAAGMPDAAVTTVDSRIAAPDDDVVLSSGDGWLRYANRTTGAAVGYLFLDGQRPVADRSTVTRSRRVVRAANQDTPVTKQVVTVTLRSSSAAYALVPHASESRLRSAGGPAVLANTTAVQAVAHRGLRLTGVNAFTDGWHRAGPLSVHGPASVLVRRGDGVRVAVSDPTMRRTDVSVLLRGTRLRVVDADDGVEVRPVPGGTLVRARTFQAHGATLHATLR
ncbi:polysaccharide lyase family 8 super-sandwich domain-containing protein [Actinophytocola sp. NPDC049390]|uniref:polysaccharide lyase family 8 super-sandwich domain-containing protein n=1 Tax=Actinophytocola sp. NPDC049390 TaxID=3363894 RepID=UPI0037B7E01A